MNYYECELGHEEIAGTISMCQTCIVARENQIKKLLEFVKECAYGEQYLNSICLKYAIPFELDHISTRASDLLKEIKEL